MKRQLIGTGIILVGVGILSVPLIRTPQPAAAAPEPAPKASDHPTEVSEAGRVAVKLETTVVTVDKVPSKLTVSGQLVFPGDQLARVNPRLSGRIRQVYVHVGDHVTIGQNLATMDSVDAATAQNAVRQAQNKLRLARQNYQRQKRLLDLGTPEVSSAIAALDQSRVQVERTHGILDRTRQQDSIGGFAQKPLEDAKTSAAQSRSDMAQAQADLAQAERERDRTSKLVEIGVAAQRDLDAAETAVQKARSTRDAANEKSLLSVQAVTREQRAQDSHLYSNQALRVAESDYQQAQLQEQAAARALHLAKTAVQRDFQQAESDLHAAESDAHNAEMALSLLGNPAPDGSIPLVSPQAGVVTDRNINPGQIVDPSQPLFTIVAAKSLWVDADLYEKDQGRVQVGDLVTVMLPSQPKRSLAGTVTYIAPQLDPKTHTIKVRTQIQNPDSALKEGQFVQVSFSPRGLAGRIRLPLESVQHDEAKTYVYVATQKIYQRRSVTVGEAQGDRVVILAGLKPGEIVVTHGALFLSSGVNL